MKSLALAVAIMCAGCSLYFGHGDDCAQLDSPDIALNEVRNPETGTCEPFGNYPCDDRCGVCPAVTEAPPPDWGSCFTQCEALDESTCLGTAGCRAAFDLNSTIDVPPSFLGCWSIAPSGPDPSACDNLDAYQCSRHDNCSAFYDNTDTGLAFVSCRAESQTPDTCANIDCGPGSHCEQQCTADGTCGPTCVPDTNACTPTSCPMGYECVTTCSPGNGCETCTISCQPAGSCEGLATEQACVSRPDCTPVYAGDDCTCTPADGCTCQILTYERCQAH